MSLEAGINATQHMEYNEDISSLVENDQIFLLDEPLTIYTQGSFESDCEFTLRPNYSENSPSLNLPDGNYFNLDNGYGLQDNFPCVNETLQLDDELAVFEFLSSNRNDFDLPEFVDINKLSPADFCDFPKVDTICISDDDDVLFVKEYKNEHVKVIDNVVKVTEGEKMASPEKIVNLKRNPARKAKLSKKYILDEDFALLYGEEKEDHKENQAPNEIPLPAAEPPNKNPGVEALPVPVKKKLKNNRLTKKRAPRAVRPKKVPISDLKPLVTSTTEMMKSFFTRCNESRELLGNVNSDICSFENQSEVFRNQIILYAVANGFDQDEAIKKVVDMVDTDNDAKE